MSDNLTAAIQGNCANAALQTFVEASTHTVFGCANAANSPSMHGSMGQQLTCPWAQWRHAPPAQGGRSDP